MNLSDDDITNIERGIDAATFIITDIASKAMLNIVTREGRDRAGPLIGFLEAIRDNAGALQQSALQHALTHHPGLEEANVTLTKEG